MTCTSFIETFSLKVLQFVAHFSCSQSKCKYISPHHHHGRPNNSSQKCGIKDQGAYKSDDMYIDDDAPTTITKQPSSAAALDPAISLHPKLLSSSPTSCSLAIWKSSPTKYENLVFEKEKEQREEEVDKPLVQPSVRRLSVQDHISLFESKQRELDKPKPLVQSSEALRRCSDSNSDMIDIPMMSISLIAVQKNLNDTRSCDSEEVRQTTTSGTGEVVLKDSACFKKQRLGEFTLKRMEKKEQSKGNQQLNHNLKMKADELEKLFREHKLHIFERRTTRLPCRIRAANPMMPTLLVSEQDMVFGRPVLGRTKDGEDHGNGLSNNNNNNTRGKLYDSYIKKRDARLMELWDSSNNRAEKERYPEILTQLSLLLVKQQDPVSLSYRRRTRAERLVRLFMKNEQFKYDEDTSAFSHIEPVDNGVSGIARGEEKPLLPLKNLSISTPTWTTTCSCTNSKINQEISPWWLQTEG